MIKLKLKLYNRESHSVLTSATLWGHRYVFMQKRNLCKLNLEFRYVVIEDDNGLSDFWLVYVIQCFTVLLASSYCRSVKQGGKLLLKTNVNY